MDLKKVRVEHNWSQDQLAEITGISTRTIQRIENGSPPSLETMKALAAGFNLSIDELREKLAANQPETEAANTHDNGFSAPLKDWKGFIIHTLILMGVMTWLLALGQYFDFDKEIIGSVAFVWGTVLVFHLVKTVAKMSQQP